MQGIHQERTKRSHGPAGYGERVRMVLRLAYIGGNAKGAHRMAYQVRGILYSATFACFTASAFIAANLHTIMDIRRECMMLKGFDPMLLTYTLSQLTNYPIL